MEAIIALTCRPMSKPMPTIDQEISRLERRLATLRTQASREKRAIETRAAVIVGATVNAHAASEVRALVQALIAAHARPQDIAAIAKAGWSWALPTSETAAST